MGTLKKYEFTDETTTINDHELRQIRALRDFTDVKAGDLGGFIESEDNLSHDGCAWVGGHAAVYDNARIYDNAGVFGNARVYGRAWVYGSAVVYDNARVYGRAWVYGSAVVYDNARVGDNALVSGHVIVRDDAHIGSDAQVKGDIIVCDNSYIGGDAQVCGARSRGRHLLLKGARIYRSRDFLTVGPIGSRADFTAFYNTEHGIAVACGCFRGTLADFRKQVNKKHGNSEFGRVYRAAANLAEKWIIRKEAEECGNADSNSN